MAPISSVALRPTAFIKAVVHPAQRRVVVARADPVRFSDTHTELKAKVTEAIHDAEETCKDGTTGECAAAWDEVEELSAAASHLADQKAPLDPLEEYCKSEPDADECRVYED